MPALGVMDVRAGRLETAKKVVVTMTGCVIPHEDLLKYWRGYIISVVVEQAKQKRPFAG